MSNEENQIVWVRAFDGSIYGVIKENIGSLLVMPVMNPEQPDVINKYELSIRPINQGSTDIIQCTPDEANGFLHALGCEFPLEF